MASVPSAEVLLTVLARLEQLRQPLTDRVGLATLLQQIAEDLAEFSGTGVIIEVAAATFAPPLVLRVAAGVCPAPEEAFELVWGGVTVGTVYLSQAHRAPLAQSLLLRVATEALAELRAAEQSVRAAEERIRRSLAVELHDHVKQVLPAIRLLTERAERDLVRDPASAALLLREVREAAQQGLDELAFLLGGLRGQSAGGDLHSALERLLAQVNRINPQLVIIAELATLSLDWERAACLLGIARGALGNVLQHARAGLVRVRLQPLATQVLLEISDDGVGTQLEMALAAPGIGLESLLERVEVLGGRAEISTAPGQGTRIRVWLSTECA